MKIEKALFAIALAAIAISSEAQTKETPLLRIGNDISSLQEFEMIYKKNNEAAMVKISKQEYFDLFVNYKLKAAEAKSQGLDTMPTYKEESEYYYKELAGQYLTDTLAIAAAREEIHRRALEEIDAGHILVQVATDAAPADTLAAYNRIAEARQRVVNGEEFEAVARQYSNDPSAAKNGGRLGYFSTLQMVTPFEDMAYKTPVGEVSDIFRTRFGYHFLKVNDRRPFGGEIKVRHIIKVIPPNAPASVADAAKHKIDSIYALAAGGADFAQLAAQNSDDRQAAMNGGEMPWLTRNAIIKEISDKIFALTKNGEITAPFRTPFGWHIAKRLDWRDKRPDATIDQMLDYAIKNSHPIGQIGRKAKAHQLMKSYNFKWNDVALKTFVGIMQTRQPDSTKTAEAEKIFEPLAVFGNGTVTASQLIENKFKWNFGNTESENIERIGIEATLLHESKLLPQKYPDFKYTMQEYYDGLLVFEINQRTIWNTSKLDSAALADLYNRNKARYSTGGTFDGTIYFCNDAEAAKKISKLVKTNQKRAAALATKVVTGKQTQGGAYDDVIWPNIPPKYAVVSGTRTDGTPQPYEEVKNEVITDYQQRLEAKWIEELRAKFNPKQLHKIE